MHFEQALQQFGKHYAERWPDAVENRSEENGLQVLTLSSPSQLRENDGNYAKILHHGEPTENVIVLIHGLTDSPYYMSAIAADFAHTGFNVVLPLLPGHGLKRPGRIFRQIKHIDWVNTVDAACAVAQSLGKKVSIGGLSTGGALSVHKIIRNPKDINGGLFLYSAALDIGTAEQLLLQTEAGRIIARLSDQTIWLEKTIVDQVKMILDDQAKGSTNEHYGIGENPYKYSVLFFEGASQLAEIIQEINQHYSDNPPKFGDISQPVFVAHSTADKSAKYKGVTPLISNQPNKAVKLFSLEDVPHASVVLKQAIISDEKHEEYTPANPRYAEMSQNMLAFTQRHLISSPKDT
ncbi:MAG: alpha/beta hydrolase [Cyanobacteria bacterium P01_C01_bin.69]